MIKNIKIGNSVIGPGNPTYTIFEVASTHENNWETAKDYIKQAKKAGADAVKFQLFRADNILNPISKNLVPTYNYFTATETPYKWFPKLKEIADKEKIDLLCTPFDEDAATFLNVLGLPAIKIASGDLTNHQLLNNVVQFKKPIILSTGMATLEEVKTAVRILEKHNSQYILLQCASIYPMPYEDANVRAMETLRNEFNCPTGYSDNGSKGDLVSLTAVALGACVIERHVTSKKQRGNMDDIFSSSVEEFSNMVKKIISMENKYGKNLKEGLKDLQQEYGNDVKTVLGNGQKIPATYGVIRTEGVKRRMTEADERYWARRGIYPKINIPKGTIITSEMLISLRPDVGISSLSYDEVLGKPAKEDLQARQPILLENNQIRRLKRSDISKIYKNADPSFVKILLEAANFD